MEVQDEAAERDRIAVLADVEVSVHRRQLRTRAVHPVQRFYRPELDALRFSAFLLVFLHHLPFRGTYWAPFEFVGQFGVSIFFLLSAYLLFTIMLREREVAERVEWQAFAMRRILRIWPLYFVAIDLALLIGFHWPPAAPTHDGLRYLMVFSGNIFIVKHGWAAIPGTLSVLWSISVEEQFYFLLPVLARFARKKSTVIAICGLVFAVSYATLLSLQHRHLDWPHAWPNSFVEFQFFAAGILVALFSYGRPVRIGPGVRLGLLLLGCCLWFCVQPVCLALGFLFLLVGSLAIFYSVLGAQIRIPRALTYLGKISYGLYVFHEMWLWAVFYRTGKGTRLFLRHPYGSVLIVLAGTIATAAVSYRYFEKPILRWKRHWEIVRTRLA